MRVPPGRAGRMWLRRRLGTAERGREQLDRKLRILVPELQRRRLQAQQWHREWDAECRAAQTWLLRVTLLGGQDALTSAGTAVLTDVNVTWTSSMGLTYPADARVVGTTGPSVPLCANAGVGPAAAAHRAALVAAIRTAAADEAVRRVEAEITVTRRRLRALDKRWVPMLQEALGQLELTLEQAEQEDGMRLRRAAAAQPDRRSQP